MTQLQALPLRPVADLRVDCRCGDGTMPKQSLDVAQIDPLFEQLRRQRMSKHVRCNLAGSTAQSRLLDDIPDGLVTQPSSNAVSKKQW